MLGWRDHVWAQRAYNQNRNQLDCGQYESCFRDGFMDGYTAVCNGESETAPVVAPEKYWTWRYRSAEGQEKIASWFKGYPQGVAAARADGVGVINKVQVAEYMLQQRGLSDFSGEAGGMETGDTNLPPVTTPNMESTSMPVPMQDPAAVNPASWQGPANRAPNVQGYVPQYQTYQMPIPVGRQPNVPMPMRSVPRY